MIRFDKQDRRRYVFNSHPTVGSEVKVGSAPNSNKINYDEKVASTSCFRKDDLN